MGEKDIHLIREMADQNIRQSQKRNERINTNKNHNPLQYQIGDFVVVRSHNVASGSSRKLIPKYRGPYRINRVFPNDRYEIVDIENCQLTRLPYRGVFESANIKK